MIFAFGCAIQQQKPETPSIEKTNPSEIEQTRDDFGCWPPTCSSIPDATGKQACEDWKAGKTIQWPPTCTSLTQPACVKLCEAEKTSQPPSQQPQQQQSYPDNQGSSPQTTSTYAQKQVFDTLPSLVKAEFTIDVSDEDKKLAIEGVSTMDSYLQKWFGKSADKPSGLQVSAAEDDPSGGAQVKTDSGTAIILIETGSFGWKRQIQSNREVGGEWRSRLVAHEYVHVYQFQNGCGRADAETLTAPKWFIEGEAEWLSYTAMKEADQLPMLSIPHLVTPGAKQIAGSLQSFENPTGLDFSAYSLFNMAVDYLMTDKPIKNLDDFCVNLDNGMSMPKAFEAAFGLPLDKFYEDFETYRKTW